MMRFGPKQSTYLQFKFAPKGGGKIVCVYGEMSQIDNEGEFRSKASLLAGTEMVYFDTRYIHGFLPDDVYEISWPFVMPLPRPYSEWLYFSGDECFAKHEFEQWSRDTIGGNMLAFHSRNDQAFYCFENVTHFLMFKMRYQDYLD
jgi:hypothetical protein